MINFYYIFLGLIGIFSGVTVKWLIPYIKAKTGKTNLELLIFWSSIFVHSAEVLINGANMGFEKRNSVLSDLRRKCKELNIEYSEEDIRATLEDAWFEMHKEAANIVSKYL